MRRLLMLSVLLPWTALAEPGNAQTLPAPLANQTQSQPAILVADKVFVTPERQLIATGNVEVFQGDVRLKAQEISFDNSSGQLKITGPIRLDEGQETTILADAAELDNNLQNGILSSARLVFQEQVQLAALQMTRVNGRYTQLYKTAVTSCDVCDDGRPPLWQIRAERVIHDEEERQLYLENAHLHVRNVRVFYLPALRLPDPTLDRASGFLVPSLRTTSNLGTGVRVPYFFKIGDHKDLTVTPYISPRTRSLELRYRQAFRTGEISLNGAYTRDDLQPDDDRGFFFADGRFRVLQDYNLAFQVRTVSDDAYIADYSLPDVDRLRSQITLDRTRRDRLFAGSLIHYTTLRDSEDQNLIPSIIADLSYEQRWHPSWRNGEFSAAFRSHSHRRISDANATVTDPMGRDVARLNVDLNWQESWRLPFGVIGSWQLGAAVDHVRLSDDDLFGVNSTRITPRSALTFRLPTTRRERSGATQYFEPILQLGWTDVSGDDVPNEESNFVEFDQGNLLSLSRFPSTDAREDGASLVYGFNWARIAPQGWQASATVGQVFRQEANSDFTKSSGLSGTSSDLLLAGQLQFANGTALTMRGLLNGSLNFSKAEVRGNWHNDKARITGSYLWLGTDPDENRSDATSELWFNGGYQLTGNWRTQANLRYDISDGRATRAGLGFAYQNECVTVDLSVNRRYTSTTSVEPSTDFGFTIALNGFSAKSDSKNYRRSCSNT
ncbi:LPS-assembly protein LptD [Epibacterium ulvae]|uniref:LPS-assembly protein LptD n=1 Tax=Epibacterium ulvae TaxID=1156985 RepID=UPI002490216D|nr:LPS assembly protein LptD [Epibacterium ulvae]